MTFDSLPAITEKAAQTAGVGLYRIKNRRRVADFYRAESDSFDRDVEQVMLARVDDGPTELPKAVHHAQIRPDGKRLIVAWVPVSGEIA